MALQFQTSYEKEGVTINLKCPKLKVVGKDLDDSEVHEFKILVDGIKVYDGTYPSYQMFVKYEDDDTAFNLELSKQAYAAILALNPEKGNLLKISKGWYDTKFKNKEGKMVETKKPCILATIEGKETQAKQSGGSRVPTAQKQQSNTLSPEAFAQSFKTKISKMKVEPQSLMFYVFAGAYLCKIKPDFKNKLKAAYDQMVK